MKKPLVRSVALWTIVWFLVLALLQSAVVYWGVLMVRDGLQSFQAQGLDGPAMNQETIRFLIDTGLLLWPFMAGVFLISCLGLWMTLRHVLQRISLEETVGKEVPSDIQPHQPKPARAPARAEPTREDLDRERRRSLLLLSLLQREGRLVDFLEEDLQSYEDAQIGAAVRSIQETCKASLDRYLGLTPILEQAEGDSITVEPGFDPGAIRLTGRVAGDPPFKGILQHRGWKAARFDLPTLSGAQTPDIIAPAEVEIS